MADETTPAGGIVEWACVCGRTNDVEDEACYGCGAYHCGPDQDQPGPCGACRDFLAIEQSCQDEVGA